jgi:hypothetical protein
MIEKIESIVCFYCGVLPDLIHAKDRHDEFKDTRQIIMYFARNNAKMTLTAIGRYFDQKHPNVISGIKRVNDLIDTDARYRERINIIETKLKIIDFMQTVSKTLNDIEPLRLELTLLRIRMRELKDTVVSIESYFAEIELATERIIKNY